MTAADAAASERTRSRQPGGVPAAGELPAGDATAGCAVCGCRPAQPHEGLPPGRAGLLLAWLAGNYRRPLRAAEIAAAAGLSVRALQATCQRECGRAPFRLLTDIRLHDARLALTTSEPAPRSVAEVAARLASPPGSAGSPLPTAAATGCPRHHRQDHPGPARHPASRAARARSRAGYPAAGPVRDHGRHSLPETPFRR